MLPTGAAEALNDAVERAERDLLADLSEELVGQEDDMTASLRTRLTIRDIREWNAEIEGDLQVRISVLDSAGPGSTESLIGADICGVINIAFNGMRVSKGFLAQAKRAGSEGITFNEAVVDHDDLYDSEFSHWLWTDEVQLEASGTVYVTRPSERLARQCRDMLRLTPASFLWVYDDTQIAIVSAQDVLAAYSKPPKPRDPTKLGTKRLADFMIHVTDSFIGDPKLTAWNRASLLALARQNDARFALRVRVGSGDDPF
ncbi:hypothetical protein ACQPXM_13270 [Kribbella sp. CA-253562]|uniref:hypothetical protein n=1 Tax=Kribbella sp. CA-253562 TaxID=3239942 RepID=UPI003D8FD583